MCIVWLEKYYMNKELCIGPNICLQGIKLLFLNLLSARKCWIGGCTALKSPYHATITIFLKFFLY